ncbi:MAG: hypothetical protein ACD_70C00208G0005 [uncultured bacterium]|nr:MAG: hypothetical protein ACD_70C00208G0005 [uncultured bacterium]OGT28340.1 MAG: hypothetical protein A2624_04285 [Gammaproteobacteria bacterium RIFCSPHIGHO2_01_FULL_42_8]OGT53049.1 MAG: hypothetical protein A3E54_08305 [Gammaproteobacteria bacterium RIFCSPHIGHO2_12_FULL_41_25]OGT61177.1 MAG: hypothetical protein A3I77_07390 [Gammaproteobacteria bacterium RIFCSPLOWO2_02_FULL_42_14]OGT87104.1 MAG: hypothetical protein A3G86_01110 [Gammaproteobacteria bacterium RIFCSPLOWO2_12_FULL_42_18]
MRNERNETIPAGGNNALAPTLRDTAASPRVLYHDMKNLERLSVMFSLMVFSSISYLIVSPSSSEPLPLWIRICNLFSVTGLVACSFMHGYSYGLLTTRKNLEASVENLTQTLENLAPSTAH